MVTKRPNPDYEKPMKKKKTDLYTHIPIDIDNNVGLMGMNANTGEVLWLNVAFRRGSPLTPLVVTKNGVFGPSYYRGS